MKCINPATQEPIDTPENDSPDRVESKLKRLAFNQWKQTAFAERSRLMKSLADVLRREKDRLAKLMAKEMGKPITGGMQEIEKCAAACDWFAEHAPAMLAPHEVESDARRSFVRFDPIGAVFAIMPWNFPFWQVIRFAAPNVMAGNVGVLKHAENVPGCAQAIEELFTAAGFPEGVFTTLLIDRAMAEELIKHPAIRAVTLTGSERAGMAVAAAAGKVLKKTVLELGGSDPFIVLADADVDAVAKAAASARCINSGQSCIAAKRFLVDQSIASRFEAAMTQAMQAMIVGDPLDPMTQVGPMARLDLLEGLHKQVQATTDAGARLLCGGRRIDRKGFFYPPTVLAGVKPGMAAFDEETFGPVAAITSFANVEEAIDLANRSRYGLGASVWTSNPQAALDIAPRIDAGCVFINGIVKSDPRLPFGGVKSSGYGRELADYGLTEFTNVKTVWVG